MNSIKKPLMLYRICFFFIIFLIGVFYWRCASQRDRGETSVSMSSPACASMGAPVGFNNEFGNPETVVIRGYNGHSMEPFITREGSFLFFNSMNDGDGACLYYARRIDDGTFELVGKVRFVNNRLPHLETVASMDMEGRFYFISTRKYKYNYSTLYCGHFLNGIVLDLDAQPGNFYKRARGWMVTEGEISADGGILYFANARFNGESVRESSDIAMARICNGDFNVTVDSSEIMKNVNTDGSLEYSPSISSDGLELIFTRFNRCTSMPEILLSKRKSLSEPFGPPSRIAAMTGFVEAPSMSGDKKTLYYHKKDKGLYSICKVSREI
ncbi:MAG: hypothetical protein JW807_09445 [Spirochaetes bacterium]|nr:hypothetical protein [Spirochaetota bacterium]